MSAFTFFLCLIVAAIGSVHGATAKSEVKFYVLKRGNLTVNFTNLGARINAFSFPDKHGGPKGYCYVVWKMAQLKKSGSSSHIIFTYKSFDGEAGFPGELEVTVKHTIQPKKPITEITAKAENKATPVNIGQHSVWNLAGHSSGSVMKHQVQIFGSKIVEVNNHLLPTGKLIPVKGTGYDFLKPHIIESNAKRVKNAYAINYVLKNGTGLKLECIVHEKKSGRILKVWTTAPNMHFCTSAKVKNVKGKGGVVYQPYSGFGLDGQEFPDAVNHKEFPSTILTKGNNFKRKNVYEFSVKP